MKKLFIVLCLITFFSCSDTETLLIEKNIEQEAEFKNPFSEKSEETVHVPDLASVSSEYPVRSKPVSIIKPQGKLEDIQSFQMSVETFVRGEFVSHFGLQNNSFAAYNLAFFKIDGHSFVRMDRDGSLYPDKRNRILISNGKKLITYFSDTMEIESASSDLNLNIPETEDRNIVPFYTGIVAESVITGIRENLPEGKLSENGAIITADLTDYYSDDQIPSLFPDMSYNVRSYFVKYNTEKCLYLGSRLLLEGADGKIMKIEEIPVYEEETGLYVRIGKVTEITYDFEEMYRKIMDSVGGVAEPFPKDLNMEMKIIEYYNDIKINMLDAAYFRPENFGISVSQGGRL